MGRRRKEDCRGLCGSCQRQVNPFSLGLAVIRVLAGKEQRFLRQMPLKPRGPCGKATKPHGGSFPKGTYTLAMCPKVYSRNLAYGDLGLGNVLPWRK